MESAPEYRIGYARVSTGGQSLEGQVEALMALGCVAVFQEKVSGRSRANRPEIRKAIAALPAGGVLVVTRLDRLGRNVSDVWQIAKDIEERGAKLRSIAEAWADTASPTGQLLLFVMGWVAEFNRRAILETAAEGLARAKRDGVVLGRPRKLSAAQRVEVQRRHALGESFTEIAAIVGVNRKTVAREVYRLTAVLCSDLTQKR